MGIQDFRRKLFFSPQSIDYFVGIVILEACKDEFLFFFFRVSEFFTDNADSVIWDFCDFSDSVNDYSSFLYDSKHVGNEHEMFLSDV